MIENPKWKETPETIWACNKDAYKKIEVGPAPKTIDELKKKATLNRIAFYKK